jgi:hypothetical protein
MSTGADLQDSITLLDAMVASLLKAGRHGPGEAEPAAILWTDADGQWLSLIPQLKMLLPQLFVHGVYEPAERQGPAIWLRCITEGTLNEFQLPAGVVPVIYLPHVSRQTLRDVEGCPQELQPLVELQYRGCVWCQRNGKDWTVEAFLVSDDGVGLDVAKDSQTRKAITGALTQLAVTPLSRLLGKRLEAEDFDKLMVEDTARDLLGWLNDPGETREKWEPARWSAFRSRCKADYGFDPESEGELVAAEKLGNLEGPWAGVWQRYAEAPALYPRIPVLLGRAKPATLPFVKKTWPDENEKAEEELRARLQGTGSMSPEAARREIMELEKEHSERREWVWARLGQSPLALTLTALNVLAETTETALGGGSPEAMAELYCTGAYLADDAVLRALSGARSAEDRKAVERAIRVIYLPWLEDGAAHFQSLAAKSPFCVKAESQMITEEAGQCIVFADGLRYDVAGRLKTLAEGRGLHVALNRSWSALPTVTATTKPAVTPVAEKLVGMALGETFDPVVTETGQSVTTERLRKLIANEGYTVMSASEIVASGDPKDKGWCEYGEIDRMGHSLQAKLAGQIDEHLELLLERIEALLVSGWRIVRLVTDHGWLLVPGGLPLAELPKYLTESRWARCATVKPGNQVPVPLVRWYWNPDEYFATAPGAACFGKTQEYAHGGISIQECLVAEMVFTGDVNAQAETASVSDVQWKQMWCRIAVEPKGIKITADIRRKVNDPASSITATKAVDGEGKAALLVEDDSLEGTTVSLVLLDDAGRVIAKRATTVGGEE